LIEPGALPAAREALLVELEQMPAFLVESLASIPPGAARRRGPEGTFAPVEHCWHLADLEREGYGARIRCLLSEDRPHLADFDGARVAAERAYLEKALSEGVEAFREARRANVALLRSLDAHEWSRSGFQDGVGEVCLSDLPRLMAEHDRGHRTEILAWLRESRP